MEAKPNSLSLNKFHTQISCKLFFQTIIQKANNGSKHKKAVTATPPTALRYLVLSLEKPPQILEGKTHKGKQNRYYL